MSDCDLDSDTVFDGELPEISIKELISICGGDIVFNDVKECGTFRWDMSEEFKDDIVKMWQICKEDPGAWNVQINTFLEAEEYGSVDDESLTTVCDFKAVRESEVPAQKKYVYIYKVINALKNQGLLTAKRNNHVLELKYKNSQIKRCLTTAGLALELIVFLYSLQATADGEQVYNDVMNGVFIDWDGTIHLNGVDTQNEIDVIAIHKMVPVFISCKNGDFDSNELYKLHTVAEKFGGKHCHKVIIAQSADEALRQRASDMRIRLIEIENKSESKIQKIIRDLWKA